MVLFDHEVILDIWRKSPERFLASYICLDICLARNWKPCLSALSIPLLEQALAQSGKSAEETQAWLEQLLGLFNIIHTDEADFLAAARNGQGSLTRAAALYAAVRSNVVCVVTHNVAPCNGLMLEYAIPEQFAAEYKPTEFFYSEEDF